MNIRLAGLTVAAVCFWIVGATLTSRPLSVVFLVLSGAYGYSAYHEYDLHKKERNDPS